MCITMYFHSGKIIINSASQFRTKLCLLEERWYPTSNLSNQTEMNSLSPFSLNGSRVTPFLFQNGVSLRHNTIRSLQQKPWWRHSTVVAFCFINEGANGVQSFRIFPLHWFSPHELLGALVIQKHLLCKNVFRYKTANYSSFCQGN